MCSAELKDFFKSVGQDHSARFTISYYSSRDSQMRGNLTV